MPSGIHTELVDIPIHQVWDFVSDINKWAPLVPGYIEHQMLNDKQSTWTFKGNVKGIEKTMSVRIDIIEWQQPNKITFNLIGLNEKIDGNGYFLAELSEQNNIQMTGFLDITAKGLKAPLYNIALKKLIPRTARQLSEAIVKNLQEEYRKTSVGI
ncbi:carbon monoxide dehydrogenase subunit G [Pullulanibacillus pueri]|uniref:SRPBCC family protein n=1 Tax=Pullulanibacillus pueri TaxID=1437324 RepID=A0A8J2ZVB0_9BACL|nr:SRPBCC family protein [Pullulanibacillus pueri]MBM7682362.1 carbon monoxide dehydrogenase subunit G [Pullulanibacillus pueri]GGH80646.1 hypothetical protein GCM10007096_17360 [Pullulanibacillus pueri]